MTQLNNDWDFENDPLPAHAQPNMNVSVTGKLSDPCTAWRIAYGEQIAPLGLRDTDISETRNAIRADKR